MDADLKALQEACEAFIEDEGPDPTPADIGAWVAPLMVAHNLSFRAACSELVRRRRETHGARPRRR